jgi:hypothetical protein
MSFNPFALVIFLVTGMFLFGSQLTSTAVLTLYFVGFVPVWLGCSILWDWIKYRNKV